MKVWTLWYGGSCYAAPDPSKDAETFESMKDAIVEFNRRFSNPYFPCVAQDAEMQVFFSDPAESRDPYPEKVLKRGIRGGVVVESV